MFDGRCRELPCPAAERACGEVVSLPIHAQLTDDEVERVCAALRRLRATHQRQASARRCSSHAAMPARKHAVQCAMT